MRYSSQPSGEANGLPAPLRDGKQVKGSHWMHNCPFYILVCTCVLHQNPPATSLVCRGLGTNKVHFYFSFNLNLEDSY